MISVEKIMLFNTATPEQKGLLHNGYINIAFSLK